jgi:hypothetical protein
MRKEKGFRLRFIKVCASKVLNQGENDFDYPITDYVYQGAKVAQYMTGAQYQVENSNVDDEIKLQVIHPAAGVVDEFANIASCDGLHLIDQYIAEMVVGLTIRLKYIRNGNNEPIVKCNLLRHIDTAEIYD